ncbi:MAG: PHP domain-containing protein [Dehalococcoidia bacterium]|nr:PHP domain-containing protein [Dehalococcoidia bacterium]MCB9485384.1 PHP domain-containing protein [Thermoflexaceae bacterium]
MLIDLHCHSFPRSQCSTLEPGQLIDLARERGLDGFCLTEHDQTWPAEELAVLGKRTGFPVFAGIELSTDMGHVLGYGLEGTGSPLHVAGTVHNLAVACGAVLYLAHPARDGLLKLDRHTIEYFDGVEGMNGSDSRLQNLAATELGKGFRHPPIGGSDAHSPGEVGRAATRFQVRIETQAELVQALRAGRYEAVRLD